MDNKLTNDNGKADEKAIIQGKKYRITVLTPALIRFEYSEIGMFEDYPTQHISNRKFDVPLFKTWEEDGWLFLETDELRLKYDQKEPSNFGFGIKSLIAKMVWNYGDEHKKNAIDANLGGTIRTLDNVDGPADIGMGLMSRYGFAVFDDSKALVIKEDDWVYPRENQELDIYFFGYEHDYKRCLQDAYKLTGDVPLLPRYAMGNWWSKYHKYSELEYKTLIRNFEKENLPFSVAVIDMDWHLVDIDKKYGKGWTGTTWNKELFPDPPDFLEWLHKHGLKTTLNVHPADGTRAFEDQYEDMANAMGIDPKTEKAVEFDIADPKFMAAYCKHINHTHEKDGVDFWWLDWQQGSLSKIPGLDPLWLLNKIFYDDNARDGKRPLIFSRYANLGSHRYPVGFSGDTIITWDSLDFQPYFTSRATNVGYVWWSHDIGGHMGGVRDDELTARWTQLGTFSPILRLHSSNNEFSGKEPWRYNKEAEASMKDSLQLRYRLIPYTYSMNYLTHYESLPLVTPLYFEEPECNEAYNVKNEFYFGTQLLACPITKPASKVTAIGEFDAWLPEGLWFDFNTGFKYKGGRMFKMHRTLQEVPVFAKAGGIIPMDNAEELKNQITNPTDLQVRVYPGADGHFAMYEDDGNEIDPSYDKWAVTNFNLKWNENEFTVQAAKGNIAVIPQRRSYEIKFYSVNNANAKLYINGRNAEYISDYDDYSHTLTVKISETSVTESIKICFENIAIEDNDKIQHAYNALQRMQLSYDIKHHIYNILKTSGTNAETLAGLYGRKEYSREVIDVIAEIILAS